MSEILHRNKRIVAGYTIDFSEYQRIIYEFKKIKRKANLKTLQGTYD